MQLIFYDTSIILCTFIPYASIKLCVCVAVACAPRVSIEASFFKKKLARKPTIYTSTTYAHITCRAYSQKITYSVILTKQSLAICTKAPAYSHKKIMYVANMCSAVCWNMLQRNLSNIGAHVSKYGRSANAQLYVYTRVPEAPCAYGKCHHNNLALHTRIHILVSPPPPPSHILNYWQRKIALHGLRLYVRIYNVETLKIYRYVCSHHQTYTHINSIK